MITISEIGSLAPIGIFDSGVGGLTVFKEVRNILPNENIIYLGDTARVPYGTKSVDVVRKYSKQNVEFLLSNGVKTIVVACNTASAASLSYLKETFKDTIIVGVIDPVVEFLADNLNVKKVGVIGTVTTIESNAYQRALKNINSEIQIFSKPCPLFVPLVEEGLFNSQITEIAIDMYLSDIRKNNVDAVILGCTHYPMLKNSIQEYFGKNVKVLDTAHYTAIKLVEVLKKNNLINIYGNGNNSFFVTDSVASFKKTAEMFLGFQIDDIFHI